MNINDTSSSQRIGAALNGRYMPPEMLDNIFLHMGRKAKNEAAGTCRAFRQARDAMRGKDNSVGNHYVRLDLHRESYYPSRHHDEFNYVAFRLMNAIEKEDLSTSHLRIPNGRTAKEIFDAGDRRNSIDQTPVKKKDIPVSTLKKYKTIDKSVDVFGGREELYGYSPTGLSYSSIMRGNGFDSVEHQGAFYVQIEHNESNKEVTKRKMMYVVPRENGTAACSVLTRKKVVPNFSFLDESGQSVTNVIDDKQNTQEGLANTIYDSIHNLEPFSRFRKPFSVGFKQVSCGNYADETTHVSEKEKDNFLGVLESIGEQLFDRYNVYSNYLSVYRDKPVYVTELDASELAALRDISEPLSPT